MNRTATGFLIMLLSSTHLAHAQTPADAASPELPAESATPSRSGEALEEIVVTAQRRSETLQNVPISASAFDTKALSRLGVTDLPNLSSVVPNLTLTGPWGYSSPQASIRGVGVSVFTQTTEGAVAIYVDDVYRSNPSTQSLNAYDIERVEILRGPQGTLYGRNATAGVISVISRKPNFTTNGMASVEYGRFNTVNAIAAGETVLSEGVGVRAAVNYRYSDGDRYNLRSGERENGQDSLFGRLTFRVQPEGSAFDSTLTLVGNRVRNGVQTLKSFGIVPNSGPPAPGQGPSTNPTTPTGANPITGYVDTDGRFDTRADADEYENIDLLGATLNMSYDFDFAKLTAITAIVDAQRDASVDADASPLPLAHATFGSDATAFTQELRLASNGGGPLSWLAGGSYLHERLRINNTNLLFFANTATVDALQKTDSIAGFVDITYKITDQLTLRAGGRYTHDRKTFGTDQVNPLIGLVIDYNDRKSWGAWSWRGVAEYRPTGRILLYASAARGFRSGGFNVNLYFDTAAQVPVDPETATNYEIGAKTQWLDNKLRINATLFNTTIDDLQVLIPSGIGQKLVNAGRARSRGAEIEIEAAPVRGLRASASLGFLSAKYRDFVLVTNGPNYRGQYLNYSPRFKATAEISYTTPLSEALDGVVAIDGNYRSSFYNNPENDPRSGDDGYGLVNGRIGVNGGDGAWDASLWMRNIFKEKFSYGGLNLQGFGFYQQRLGEPRTYGVSLSYRF
jgi:iron complex outermembrane receptor protein